MSNKSGIQPLDNDRPFRVPLRLVIDRSGILRDCVEAYTSVATTCVPLASPVVLRQLKQRLRRL